MRLEVSVCLTVSPLATVKRRVAAASLEFAGAGFAGRSRFYRQAENHSLRNLFLRVDISLPGLAVVVKEF